MMETQGDSLFKQAAKASCLAPIIVIGVGILSRIGLSDPAVRTGIAFLNALFLVAGLVLGIVALFGIRK